MGGGIAVSPFQGDRGGVFELPAQHRRDVVALVNDVIAEAVAVFGDLVKAVSEGYMPLPGLHRSM